MTANGPLLRNSRERAEYGCICTFENAAGKWWSIHQPGPPMEGVKSACAIALARDETFRLISYSTPVTIYEDMKGARLPKPVRAGEETTRTRPQGVEATILGRLTLVEMLHPRLVP